MKAWFGLVTAILQTLFIKVVPGQSFLGLCLCRLRRVFSFCKKFPGCERTVQQHRYAVVCMWPAKHRLCSEVMFCFHEVQTWHLTRQNVTADSTIGNKSSSFTVCVCVRVPPASEKWRSGSHGWPGAHPSLVALVVTQPRNALCAQWLWGRAFGHCCVC